jgi:hypothetical protein
VEDRHREKNAEFAAKYRAKAVQAEKRGWPDAAERWRDKAAGGGASTVMVMFQ